MEILLNEILDVFAALVDAEVALAEDVGLQGSAEISAS